MQSVTAQLHWHGCHKPSHFTQMTIRKRQLTQRACRQCYEGPAVTLDAKNRFSRSSLLCQWQPLSSLLTLCCIYFWLTANLTPFNVWHLESSFLLCLSPPLPPHPLNKRVTEIPLHLSNSCCHSSSLYIIGNISSLPPTVPIETLLPFISAYHRELSTWRSLLIFNYSHIIHPFLRCRY